jgi:hypothetical protein
MLKSDFRGENNSIFKPYIHSWLPCAPPCWHSAPRLGHDPTPRVFDTTPPRDTPPPRPRQLSADT